MRVVSVLALVCVSAACEPPKPPEEGPEAAYRAFAAAVASGDSTAAWKRIDAKARARLDRDARRNAEARGVPAPPDGSRLLLETGGRPPSEPKSVTVLTSDGAHATVTVTDASGEPRDVPPVREVVDWKVELSALLAAE